MASVVEKYDIDEVETNLNELERELDDEMKLENTLDGELNEQLESVTKFTQLKEVVSNQKKRALQLRDDIKKLVLSNDEKTEKNKELSSLLESEEFLQVKQDALDTLALVTETRNFLVQKDRVGRPPMKDSN